MRKRLMALIVAAAFPLAAIAATSPATPETPSGNKGASGSVGVGSSTEPSGGVRDMGVGAKRDGASGPGAARTEGPARAEGTFHPLDTNRDGFISRDEARGTAELNSRFNELDKNGDGRLSAEEMRGAGPSPTAGQAGRSATPGASGSVGVGTSTEPSGGVRDTSPSTRTAPSGGGAGSPRY